jgi:hypothetical protein
LGFPNARYKLGSRVEDKSVLSLALASKMAPMRLPGWHTSGSAQSLLAIYTQEQATWFDDR